MGKIFFSLILLSTACGSTKLTSAPVPCTVIMQPVGNQSYLGPLSICRLQDATGLATVRVDVTVAGPETGYINAVSLGTGRAMAYGPLNGSLAHGSLSLVTSEPRETAWQLPWLDSPDARVSFNLPPEERLPLEIKVTISY